MNAIPFVTSRSALRETCARLAAAQAPQLPLWQAAADGRLAVVLLYDPSVRWPGGALKRIDRPVCVLLGADLDNGGPDPTPGDWKAARKLRDWCKFAMIHGAGGEADHYREAAALTVATGRLALIETTSLRACEWSRFLYPKPGSVIVPVRGQHPLPRDRATVH